MVFVRGVEFEPPVGAMGDGLEAVMGVDEGEMSSVTVGQQGLGNDSTQGFSHYHELVAAVLPLGRRQRGAGDQG